jgi:biopolymer transport protein ExbB
LRRIELYVALVVCVAWLWLGQEVRCQEPGGASPVAPSGSQGAPEESAAADSQADSASPLLEFLKAGGIIGLLIMLLSVGAVALVVEHLMTIRASVLMPAGLADEVRELLTAGKVGPASQRCGMEPSLLAHVLGAGLAEADGGWPAVEKAVEDATAEQSARLFRKVEYLSVIGNIAPMLGLLGTVIGMILAFRKVADTQGAARAADLAEGIYLALVTTVEGLIVAIPSLAAFAVFRNRVDQLVAEATYVAQHVFAPLKRSRVGSLPKVPAGPRAPAPPRGPAPPPVGGQA